MVNNHIEAYWQTKTRRQYRRMMMRHRRLWEYLRAFIERNRIGSILEVGCGMVPPARHWVAEYQGIDLCAATDAIHADFCTMDVSRLGYHDLFLACNVIEHCNGYEQFLGQMRKCSFAWAIVVFFRDVLKRTEDFERINDRGIYVNKYASVNIERALQGYTWQWRRLDKHNTILTINGAAHRT